MQDIVEIRQDKLLQCLEFLSLSGWFAVARELEASLGKSCKINTQLPITQRPVGSMMLEYNGGVPKSGSHEFIID